MGGNNFEITFFNYPSIWGPILVQSLLEEKRPKQRLPLGIVATTAINTKVRAENLFLHEDTLVLGVESSAAHLPWITNI